MGGPLSDEMVSENGVWILIVMGFHTAWEATSIAIKAENSTSWLSMCQAAACCAPLPTRGRLMHHLTTSRWDRVVTVSTMRALPLSSRLRLRHLASATNTQPTILVEDDGNRLIRIIDGRGPKQTARRETQLSEDNPPTTARSVLHVVCFSSSRLPGTTTLRGPEMLPCDKFHDPPTVQREKRKHISEALSRTAC